MRALPLALVLALSGTALAQQPMPGQAPQAPPLPPPKPPQQARPVEGARVVERDIARAAGEGNSALVEGRFEDARRSYEEAQVLAPELPELEYNRGVSLLLSGELEEAEQALQQGLSLTPVSYTHLTLPTNREV